jgi:hypothetical protein
MSVHPLIRHPAAPCAHVAAVSVQVDRISESLLALRYRVECDLDRLEVPEPRPPVPMDDLWRHTCFEAFAKRGGARAYLELNFSPSSEWAIYAFEDYRHGRQPLAARHPPEIVCRSRGGLLEADVRLRLDDLLPKRTGVAGLRLGMAAVLEDRQGQLSYWALAHPADRPDFHHPDSFVLSLPALGAAA